MKPAKSPENRLLSIDELDRDIVNLAARINAATYELLVLIRQSIAARQSQFHDVSFALANNNGPACREPPSSGVLALGSMIIRFHCMKYFVQCSGPSYR